MISSVCIRRLVLALVTAGLVLPVGAAMPADCGAVQPAHAEHASPVTGADHAGHAQDHAGHETAGAPCDSCGDCATGCAGSLQGPARAARPSVPCGAGYAAPPGRDSAPAARPLPVLLRPPIRSA